ncbi:MAG: hypothetical protein MZU79_02570 [Anaerotruncus sp.]|nr:hypothetical protein [Anaerotruncus sp.]
MQLESIASEESRIAYNEASLAEKLADLAAYCAALGETHEQACNDYFDQYQNSAELRDAYYDLFNNYVYYYGFLNSSTMNVLIGHLYDWYWTGNNAFYQAYEDELAAIDESWRSYYQDIALAYIAWQNAIHPYEALIDGIVDEDFHLIKYQLEMIAGQIATIEADLEFRNRKNSQ